MTRAQCYYEILGVSETATSDEVKRAYRNLALVWHPDKNQANPDEAHAKFQSILKAYETLSDSREREWYDRHKDLILSGGDKNDVEACISLFQYFSASCYANFDDSEDGFYTVYRKVFEEIAHEEESALETLAKYSKSKSKGGGRQADQAYPSFGSSDSEHEDTVGPFYAFWSGFCTHLTFDHLDKYNTTEAENRRILRAMEKENKKVKDAARKERNTNVRNLVEFIKKRDRRLKAHKLLVEQQNELNRKKTAEKQRQQRQKCLKESIEFKPTAWEDLSEFEEQLQQLESEYDDLMENRKGRSRHTYDEDDNDSLVNGDKESGANEEKGAMDTGDNEFGQGDERRDDADREGEEEEEESFVCPTCNKGFRTLNAFNNHEASKKHKQKVLKLAKLLEAQGGSLK